MSGIRPSQPSSGSRGESEPAADPAVTCATLRRASTLRVSFVGQCVRMITFIGRVRGKALCVPPRRVSRREVRNINNRRLPLLAECLQQSPLDRP
ncbi:hypothetical protein E2C01_068199 [Portunus trituberculatus]|uniref:Uncharacterized protein n=1 Tax=Portunus trituberculatus TaxID=210409 RepID=A0A5B7HVX2_PORTR|nr:hypothetical protein [Portunus trituberculatus]